jgi:hypothetical protein
MCFSAEVEKHYFPHIVIVAARVCKSPDSQEQIVRTQIWLTYFLTPPKCSTRAIIALINNLGIVCHQNCSYLLRQPDAGQFVEAVIKEVNGHNNNNHWKLIPHGKVPEDTEDVPSVWAIQRKRDLTRGAITKHWPQPSWWEARIWQKLL